MRQFLINERGERTAVVLPIEEYEELLERLEDAEALREADEVLTAIERGEEDPLPLNEAMEEIEAERRRLRESGGAEE
ncbi:MAG TPA: type II toxin-antitoxin system prevent-host-death family antitoxin [Rubrobacteraceae bacterium]|nr:type II toxin-antitoxin system prevent-host-death family antitoxin [Rubrobacteraceae bacterium]